MPNQLIHCEFCVILPVTMSVVDGSVTFPVVLVPIAFTGATFPDAFRGPRFAEVLLPDGCGVVAFAVSLVL